MRIFLLRTNRGGYLHLLDQTFVSIIDLKFEEPMSTSGSNQGFLNPLE